MKTLPLLYVLCISINDISNIRVTLFILKKKKQHFSLEITYEAKKLRMKIW